jgi:D-glycero-alpha-D-manno-heptose-7-phosphate kinase
MLFRARAPLRLSFAGGGTDVPPFPAEEGGLVLSATISRYAYATLRPREDANIRIESHDLGFALEQPADAAFALDGRLDLAKTVLQTFASNGPPARGFDLLTEADAPPGSGLGSSSAVMVALIGVLRDFHRLTLTPYEVAALACRLEREELQIAGGLQDQYAATFGGFNVIEFTAAGVTVNPLRIGAATRNELEHNLLLCYTGAVRASDQIIDDQTRRLRERHPETLAGLRAQKELAEGMKSALLRGHVNEFGSLLDEAWQAKRKLSPRIVTPFIEEAYASAREHGALGGKVTGAGGGGHMVFYCPQRKYRVAEALAALGASVAEFSFCDEGLATWSVSGD